MRAWDSVAKGDLRPFSNMGAPAPGIVQDQSSGACLPPPYSSDQGNPPSLIGEPLSPEPRAPSRFPRASSGLPCRGPHLSTALAASPWPSPQASEATNPLVPEVVAPGVWRLPPSQPCPAALVNKTLASEQPLRLPRAGARRCTVSAPRSPGPAKGHGGGGGGRSALF